MHPGNWFFVGAVFAYSGYSQAAVVPINDDAAPEIRTIVPAFAAGALTLPLLQAGSLGLATLTGATGAPRPFGLGMSGLGMQDNGGFGLLGLGQSLGLQGLQGLGQQGFGQGLGQGFGLPGIGQGFGQQGFGQQGMPQQGVFPPPMMM